MVLIFPHFLPTLSKACLVREEAIEPLQKLQLSPSTIRVWIPIASNYLAMWGVFEHAQVIPSTTGFFLFFCFVLFCFVLFCFVLFCFVLFCFVLFCFVFFFFFFV